MKVVVEIDGREAIPLRAVPYLSSWQGMTPEGLVCALAGHDVFFQFKGLLAHRKDGEGITHIRPRDWENTILAMTAAKDRIKHAELSHSEGKDQARQECLRLLPPGCFVWRDEFEPMYLEKYEGVPYFSMNTGEQVEPSKRKELVELDYDPFIQDREICNLVMEGFEHQQAATDPPGIPSNAPVMTERADKATPKPVQRSFAQDAAILAAIRAAGFDPLELPKNEDGKPGPKAAIRAALSINPLFIGSTVFDKAWERLRKRGEIADSP